MNFEHFEAWCTAKGTIEKTLLLTSANFMCSSQTESDAMLSLSDSKSLSISQSQTHRLTKQMESLPMQSFGSPMRLKVQCSTSESFPGQKMTKLLEFEFKELDFRVGGKITMKILLTDLNGITATINYSDNFVLELSSQNLTHASKTSDKIENGNFIVENSDTITWQSMRNFDSI